MNSQQMLDLLNDKVKECQKCDLSKTRTHTVFGEGNPNSKILFIGEAPGRNEDEQGRPFVGKAGELLNNIIVACGLKREDIFIANILKCRPPENRTPTEVECASCMPFLKLQMKVLCPMYIICLGATATNSLLGEGPLSFFRGKWHDYSLDNVAAKVICTYHPSYLLRNPDAKKDCWQDLQLLVAELHKKQVVE